MVVCASDTAVYGAVVATSGFLLACISLGWNVINTIRDRRARRRPEVHAAVVIQAGTGASSIAFANAGPGMARHTMYVMVEGGHVIHGGLDTPYLKADETAKIDLPPNMQPKLGERSPLVWVCMDGDGNVYARSNKNDRKFYEHPAVVDVADVFREFYPDVQLPGSLPALLVGE